ncbi:SRPBCC domain-containing protein [Micromonospora sp. HM5-17]|uniref:SRPBCC domain-containing protein n=1 Tax=Micromonospora sp. HM5-17 TaxID=2487710 RepID=UPI000F4678C3|nr:SRPBCC domain-containing protein [Micromonospora sp. HM5-17]ROT29526.1 hypothetical protein EF879_17795 [Micromonospora sp. HM5-17]
MTEIRTAVDLRHPADRVWQALTDRDLLAKWFASVEPRPTSISRFTLRPVDLPELDELVTVELVDLDPPHRMELRWRESDRATRLVCEVTPTAEGCRLAVTHSAGEEPWDLADPDRRQRCYQQLLDTRLPAVLDWLAFGEVDLPATSKPHRGTGPAAATGSVGVVTPVAARRSRYRLGVLLAVVALVVGGVVVTVGLVGARNDRQPPTAPVAANESPTATPSRTTPDGRAPVAGAAPVQPSRSTRPSPPRTPNASTTTARTGAPGRARLTARYATVTPGLLGYEAEVVVANEGEAPATGWTVVLTLPGVARVSAAEGADYRQEQREVTFTGPPLPAGRSVTIRFEVTQDGLLGPRRPSRCVVQDEPCAGL